FHLPQEGGGEARLVHGLVPHMAVEVAIGALGRAEGPMHIDAETGFAGVGQERGVEVQRGSGLQTGFDEALEGAGAMRQGFRLARLPAVLLVRAHFPERQSMTLWLKDRIITETFFAARWPDDRALHLAAEE